MIRRRATKLPRRDAVHRSGPVARLALALAVTTLLGCAAVPPTRYHTLLPSLGADASQADGGSAAAAAGEPVAIALGPVAVPLQVDQPQWLVRMPDQSLALLENERWASPLHDELRAALRDRLARRWAVVDLSVAGHAATWRLDLEVLRFESIPGQAAWIDARWTLTPARGASAVAAPAVGCAATLRETVAAGSTALADGHRRAVIRLADAIGRQLRNGGSCETSPA